MAKKIITTAMLIAAAALIALAVATLLPIGTAKPNDFGYVSFCPFAPWSTLMLLLGAGVLWAVRNYVLTRID